MSLPLDNVGIGLIASRQHRVRRLLVPDGRLVITHFDWIPLPGNVVEATEKLIEQHNPEWKMSGGRGMYSRWLSDVAIAGFQSIETFSFDIFVLYSHGAWRGRIRASAGIAASLSPEQVTRFDSALQTLGRVLKLLITRVRQEYRTRSDSQRGQSQYRA